MKKLLLLSLLSITGGAFAMEPIEPVEPQSDTLATSLFKIAATKALATNKNKNETLTALNDLLKETKNNPAQEPAFIKEQLKEHCVGLKVHKLKPYNDLFALYNESREALNQSFSQTFDVKGHSFTIDKPKSENDYESARIICRDQHISVDACYLPFRVLFRTVGAISNGLNILRTAMGKPIGGTPEDMSKEFIKDVKMKEFECNVLRDNSRSEVIGFITYRPEVDKTYIGDICVDEKYRGHGLGKALIDSVIAQEKQLGVTKVYLHSDPKPAEFYRHIGMIQNGTLYLGIASQPIFEKNI
jgi:ribosomal protein S18 acetylase RimI-like enzyme